MFALVKKWLSCYWPYLLIIVLGITGTELYKASEGVRGSPFVNQPGALSLIDEGEQLEWTQRILHGQIPYRDFWSLYTPLRLYLLAGMMKLFGESILTERIYFALFPLLGFLSFFALVKIFTKNIIVSLFATIAVIATNAVGERNALFVVALYFFAVAFPFYQDNKTSILSFSQKRVFICGIFSSLTFLLSQEFGVYIITGITIFTLLFYLINRFIFKEKKVFPIKTYLKFLLNFFGAIAIVLVPYFLYLIVIHAFGDFLQNVFFDFSSGGIAKLWTESLPSFYTVNFGQVFSQNGYLYSISVQIYALIVFFVVLIATSLFKLIRSKEGKAWWIILFVSMFGLINVRGLFYSQTSYRMADVLGFFFLSVVLIDFFFLPKITKKIHWLSFLTIGFVFLLNWYTFTLLPLHDYLNNLSEMLTFSHHPRGILFDQKRANIRFYPSVIDDAEQKYWDIKPQVSNLNSLINKLDLDFTTKETFSQQFASEFNGLEPLLSGIQLSSSKILNHDRTVTSQLKSVVETSADLDLKITSLENEVEKLKGQVSDETNANMAMNKIDDNQWFEAQYQLKYINYLLSSLNNIHLYLTYLQANLTPAKINENLNSFINLEEIANYLGEEKGNYVFGTPLASVYVFLADKINISRFSPTLTNVSYSQQQKTIKELDEKKPCRAVRTVRFEDKSFAVQEYFSLVWNYLDKNYTVVKNIAGVDLLQRNDCGIPQK